MIPKDLTHAEAGAYLLAVGQHMIDNDVCAEAVVDPDMLKDLNYAMPLIEAIQDAGGYEDMEEERAIDILTNLTLEEAIEFNRAGRTPANN